MKTPSSKWRVYVGRVAPDLHESFRSQTKAYEYVREQLPFGHKITVQQWEDGRWRLYEVFPEAPKDDSEDAAARRLADN